MKKNYLLGMALIASLSFYSCDKEVVYVQDGNGVESVADGNQIITLQVENGGDGLATRAGRPLYSAEAKQSIDNVKLWICDNTTGKVVYVKKSLIGILMMFQQYILPVVTVVRLLSN